MRKINHLWINTGAEKYFGYQSGGQEKRVEQSEGGYSNNADRRGEVDMLQVPALLDGDFVISPLISLEDQSAPCSGRYSGAL